MRPRFKFALGSPVAQVFDAGLFSGVVDKRFTDGGELWYHVTFEDGDAAEYEQDEIAEMVALRGKTKMSSGRRKRVRAAPRCSVLSALVAGTAESRFAHAHQCC